MLANPECRTLGSASSSKLFLYLPLIIMATKRVAFSKIALTKREREREKDGAAAAVVAWCVVRMNLRIRHTHTKLIGVGSISPDENSAAPFRPRHNVPLTHCSIASHSFNDWPSMYVHTRNLFPRDPRGEGCVLMLNINSPPTTSIRYNLTSDFNIRHYKFTPTIYITMIQPIIIYSILIYRAYSINTNIVSFFIKVDVSITKLIRHISLTKCTDNYSFMCT